MEKLNARKRLIILLIIDSLIVFFSIFVCYEILEPYFKNYSTDILIISAIVLLLSHHVFAYLFNLYHRAWEYASVSELFLIVESVTCSILATILIVPIFTGHPPFLRLYLITWMMHLILIGGSRIFWRVSRKYVTGVSKPKKKPTLIVGAGRGGSLLIRQMIRSDMDLEPVLAVDDDPDKRKLAIANGVKVQGTIDDIPHLTSKFKIKRIIIAIPTLSASRYKEINEICNSTGIELFKMPSIEDVLSGELEVNQLKKVEVEDLLGREPVELDMAMISKELTHQTILVTGAGGSIGSEICRQVCKFQPERIILLGHGENSIYLINQELTNLYGKNIEIVPVIADVQNKERIEQIVNIYKPYAIYHAAAHKHVPLMEYNPEEAFNNNVIGTRNVAVAAKKARVRKFVMISTDKAVNPPNVMGASKRVAEMIIQSLNDKDGFTDFVAVRFGNVLGSRGSVIPLFKKQIEAGGPVTVTHPDMTRYFMTIPEASRLVLQAGALAEGGEVFVLDMGEPVKIVDLARNLIRLSGKKEDEIKIKFSGIRPGEKLYEELLNENEVHPEQVYEKIYRGKTSVASKEELDSTIKELVVNKENIREILLKLANRKF
ncbi:nucleoside-diphosphate sugar epimerase/dehydratase [Staphylococcus capitis]|uniref:nucleoside-diphosphate sugar epimerase/dehydratase n=2 Tax=Staphylococcus capitis TaxID=29388 RepID=UPI001D13F112|nr:nucleoside-diphosphate sugar epimerase/dehydratase [Staphylococcus capitis]MCC3756091.1 polysaccharide biosynthesis protein [Staphylococcus capitis]MDH8729168.1 nucleoside-diphosphate sugar epimerase/dehydratase [Staphylococcus capitis]MDH8922434.1 nucleoside-diphosphate sugar epimerase/dehydratase [Staphylococcus capitis]MDH8942555.1 nucleoside-diphosphate sugar epimerase/dehydratase [Staphylococcus capitis]MDH9593623.1 nucleoside-diphosphate sugar epimerase/dehydratase [Staphylococcus cap